MELGGSTRTQLACLDGPADVAEPSDGFHSVIGVLAFQQVPDFSQNGFFAMRVSGTLLGVQQTLQCQVADDSGFIHQSDFVNGRSQRGGVRIHLRNHHGSGKKCRFGGVVQIKDPPQAIGTTLRGKTGEYSLAGLRFDALSALWRTQWPGPITPITFDWNLLRGRPAQCLFESQREGELHSVDGNDLLHFRYRNGSAWLKKSAKNVRRNSVLSRAAQLVLCLFAARH